MSVHCSSIISDTNLVYSDEELGKGEEEIEGCTRKLVGVVHLSLMDAIELQSL